MTEVATMTHLAGDAVYFNTHVRQRCGWCGRILVDQDSAKCAVSPPPPPGTDVEVLIWPVGRFVEVTDGGGVSWVLEETSKAPDNSCMKLDPAVTA